LAEKFDPLLRVVDDLSSRVITSEKLAASAVGGSLVHPGKTVQGASKSELSCTTLTWGAHVEGSNDSHPTMQCLARDEELSRLLDEYHTDGDDLLHVQDACKCSCTWCDFSR
jgi:hypothetical protein